VSGLAPHQERVLEERKQLNERLAKLTAFLEKGQLGTPCDDDEWGRLWKQAGFMESYLAVLDARIIEWDVTPVQEGA